MDVKSEIREMFNSLEKFEQIELLKELSGATKSSQYVIEFSNKHLKKFKSNIEFSILQTGPQHCPIVKAIVHTAYGEYTGCGTSKEVAKTNAIDLANLNWK